MKGQMLLLWSELRMNLCVDLFHLILWVVPKRHVDTAIVVGGLLQVCEALKKSMLIRKAIKAVENA